VEITCRVYRPRRPRESPLFRLVEQHLEELLRVWPTRLQRQHGPLRPVVERVLAHRHVVLTIPRLLRPLFRRRRDLLTELARAGAEATVELVRRKIGYDVRPGLVVSVATAGLTSDGGFAADGTFVSLAQWDAMLLLSLFRERILARLLARHAISKELVQRLLAWRHPGFSAHVGAGSRPSSTAPA
jgi:hypothetical protein